MVVGTEEGELDVTEELKAQDQMKCVRLMNHIKASAEEIVLKAIVYI